MLESKRDRRRRDALRRKNHARFVLRYSWGYRPEDMTPRAVGINANRHCAHYPCGLCCNRRRAEGPTFTERRFMLREGDVD